MIASCIAVDGRTNFLIKTTPSRRVQFRDCQATVSAEVDMPRVLQEPGVVVEIQDGFFDWLPGWVKQIPIGNGVKAEIIVPNGYTLMPDYTVTKDQVDDDDIASLMKTPPTVGRRRRTPEGDKW